MKLFQAEAQISKIVTMSDRTIRLSVDCQELSPEHEALIFALRRESGWFLFSPQEIQHSDIKDLPPITVTKNEKSPSSRLRNVLFRLWEQSKQTEVFDVYYKNKMEKFIDHIKGKLD